MQGLAVFLVITTICILTVGKWSEDQIKERNSQLFGNWDEVFLDVDPKDVDYFRQHAFIDDYAILNIQEKIFLEGDDRIIVGTCDDQFFRLGNLEMLAGRLPEKEGEIAIEEEYLDVLGVEKIGDRIEADTNVDSLKGYEVCGIVKNYSARWRMVNWDVKYINCFISNAEANEIQIYTSLSSATQKDVETNMLEYRENIKVDFSSRMSKRLTTLWIGIIVFIMVIHFNILSKLKSYNDELIKSYQNRCYTDNKMYMKRIILGIVQVVLTLHLCYLILVLTNKIILNENYFCLGSSQYTIEEKFVGKYLKMTDKLQFYLNDPTSYKIEVLQIIPDIYIESIVEITNILILIFLTQYIIGIITNFNQCKDKNMLNYAHLSKYYYNYSKKRYYKIICSNYLKDFIVYNFLCITLLFLHFQEYSYRIICSNIAMLCLINASILLFQIGLGLLLMNKKENKDWLLSTDYQ